MNHVGIGHRNYLRSGAPRHNNVQHKRWAYLRSRQRQRSIDKKGPNYLSL